LIVTADVSVENVHFSLDTMTFEEIGYKAMVTNLSDCAAMGATPDSAVVQLVFPVKKGCGGDSTGKIVSGNAVKNCIDNNDIDKDGIDNDEVDKNYAGNNCVDINESTEQIYAGFARACREWNFPIVGGDLSGGGAWVIGITLIGSVPPGGRVVRRTGTVDGDALWVTGIPGESAAGLAALMGWGRGKIPPQYQRFVNAHISPTPRINEGRAFAGCQSIHSMMDLSDGLSKDIATLCFDNNLGFIFERGLEQRLPSAIRSTINDMMSLADELGRDWRDWFYHGGEEYELLISCDPSLDPREIINNINDVNCIDPANMIRLGHFTSQTSKRLIAGDDGAATELPSLSWDHCNVSNKVK
jgi:thiamine-monophosphate kinase